MLKAVGADINNYADELALTGAVITMHSIIICNVAMKYNNTNFP